MAIQNFAFMKCMLHVATSVLATYLLIGSSIALAEGCTEVDQLRLAKDYVSSRLCGKEFDDRNVSYHGAAGELMRMLRAPFSPGRFRVDWDAIILGKDAVVDSIEKDDDGSLVVRFRFHRLGVSEGGAEAHENIFRVFVRDENKNDSFEIRISPKCEVSDPPIARVHPSRIHDELSAMLRGFVDGGVGNCCDELHDCRVIALQVKTLAEQWPGEIRANCVGP